jgi:outer membrane receptor protein involved in Fe transport
LAQTAASGTITGTVTDPSGSSVPGAAIAVKNTDTGAGRSIQTNDAGVYSATFLQPGHYEIDVTKAGFTTVDRKGVTVEVGRTIAIDFKLTVKSGSEAVTVTGEAPLVDSEKTDVSQEIDQNMVKDLPLVGRRWDSFVLLTPGVASDGALVSYRGLSGLYNNNLVDGANNNQSFLSESRGRSAATTGAPYVYSLDSIDQFQVESSNYSAEFGQAAGGVVNAVTKSGANALHGDLFYYLRYPALNALDSYNKSQGINTQSVHQFQQFGGSVGGAIVKDKLFYFFTYDGSRKVFPIAYTSTSKFPLPCPAQLTATQCTEANGYLAGLVGAYARTGVNDVGFGKIDYQINSANRASLAFNLEDYHAPNSYNSSASVANNSVTANGPIVLHERFLVGTLESTIASNAVNKFLFQWGMDNEITGANSGGPSVTVASVMAYGMPNALPRGAFPNERRWQQSDTMSITAGKHTIKFGVDVNEIHEVIANLYQGGGIYSYSGSATAAFDNWALDVFGINIGDGLTGKHYNSFVQVTDPITGIGKDDWWEQDFGGFVEDSWKVRPNLTFNLGLRYDVQLTPQPPRPNISTPLNAALTSHINEDTNNFGPRLGIAWNPIKDTVVRAGYGMFYGKTTNSTFYTYRVENGIFQQTFNCSVTTCPGLSFPNILFTPPGPAPAAPFAGALTPTVTAFSLPLTTQLTRGLTNDFVNPLVHEGDLTIERQLPGNMSITASYLFSRGLHLPVFDDGNLGASQGTHTYTVTSNTAGSAFGSTVTVPWYPSGDRIDKLTGDVLTGYSVLNSWYNALALTLKHPMSHGVEFVINYTFAKSIDDGAVAGTNGTFNGTDYPLDPHNQKQENSLSDLNQKNRFTGSVIYAPTYFHKLNNKALRAFADGWAYSVVGTFFSGLPVFATISGYASGGVDYGVTGGEVTNSGGSTGGRPPQVGRNVYIGPGMENIDFRIQRDFAVKEKYHLTFMGEAFNVFNHTNITSVNGTAFNYVASCSAMATGNNGCIEPNAAFLAPTSSTSSNGLYGARQLQVSAKFSF